MTQTTQPTLTTGIASYPPNYSAPGALLDRQLRRYIGARIAGHAGTVASARKRIDNAIVRVENERRPFVKARDVEPGMQVRHISATEGSPWSQFRAVRSVYLVSPFNEVRIGLTDGTWDSWSPDAEFEVGA